jgi:chaperonin GroES
MAKNITPLGQRVLVKRLTEAEEKTQGGIIIPDAHKEKPQEAQVVALGIGKNEDGEDVTFTVKVGDRVLVSKYGGTEIKLDGVEHVILNENDILGILG